MTREFRQTIECPKCGNRFVNEDAFRQWVRKHPALDSRTASLNVCDVDMLFHKFKCCIDNIGTRDLQYLMLVEVKTRGAELSDEQRELLQHVDAIFRSHPRKRERDSAGHFLPGHGEHPRLLFSKKQGREITVIPKGVHLLRLSGSTPDDSEQIIWDKSPIDHDRLIGVLRFEFDPDNPQKRMEHRRRKREKRQPLLFSDF